MGVKALPLSGIRVVDVSQVGAGPYATSLLGDFGADVIKVEPPSGDSLRYIDDLFGPSQSGYFSGINRSKRGIVLDLKLDEGRAVLHRLLEDADVFMISMRPDATHRLGIAYEDLSPFHPRLVYCSITAFGEDGPIATEPGMDILAQARGGMMGMTGEPDGPPIKAGPPEADFVASFLACTAITLALRSRDMSGVGQKVSVNLLDGQVALLANYMTPFIKSGIPFRPAGGGHPQIVPYQAFQASDSWFIVACLTEAFWPRFCRAVGLETLIADAKYARNPDRVRHRDELVGLLQALFATQPAEQWLQRLRDEDVPCSPVNRLEQIVTDPQVVHNGMILDLEHPVHGPIRTVNNPIRLEGTPAQPHGYPPVLGEHTGEVLLEIGLSPGEIAKLADLGVINGHPRPVRHDKQSLQFDSGIREVLE